jgi:hypothetical protein
VRHRLVESVEGTGKAFGPAFPFSPTLAAPLLLFALGLRARLAA